MSSKFREEIHNSMNLREAEDLLSIWQTNDRNEWSDIAFDVIKEILQQRSVEIPAQSEPSQSIEKEDGDNDDEFTGAEIKIIDDENPPDFYNPFEVLNIVKQIRWAAKAMIVLTIIYNLFVSSRSYYIVLSFFPQDTGSPLVYLLTFLLVATNTAMSILIIYLPLQALAHLLTVLMEMEFNSRKA